jgi:uracil-DNA glycosylase family 4
MKPVDVLNRRIVECERCPRLRTYCQGIAAAKRRSFAEWDYWGKPVPNLGPTPAGLLVVGLAPAAHGGNRTGRIFTGDRSGDWLYRALHKAGFANQPTSTHIDDGLKLTNCVVTAVCHCAPPDNKPLPSEIENCREWFVDTIDVAKPRVFVALGQLAWRAIIDEARRRDWYAGSIPKFTHGAKVELSNDRWLLGSYHPSQRNTLTRTLTEPMFDAVFTEARRLIAIGSRAKRRSTVSSPRGRG